MRAVSSYNKARLNIISRLLLLTPLYCPFSRWTQRLCCSNAAEKLRFSPLVDMYLGVSTWGAPFKFRVDAFYCDNIPCQKFECAHAVGIRCHESDHYTITTHVSLPKGTEFQIVLLKSSVVYTVVQSYSSLVLELLYISDL